MSWIFGEMRQIGIVVRDIDKAMRHWVEVCGVGPWFYAERLPLTNYRYKSQLTTRRICRSPSPIPAISSSS
jgi:glyoxalase/bleomycin resistance protein/dioxygenase superfamily protein